MNLIFTLGKEYFGTSKADAQANLLLSLTTCLIAFLESNMCIFDVTMKQNSVQQTGVDMADNISDEEIILKRKNSQDEGKETQLKDSKVDVEVESEMTNALFLLAGHLHSIVNRKVRKNIFTILLLAIS